jgi:hypothetical protein
MFVVYTRFIRKVYFHIDANYLWKPAQEAAFVLTLILEQK